MYCLLFYCLLFYCLLFINAIKASPLFNLKYIGYILVISHLTFKGLCINCFNPATFLWMSQARTWIFNTIIYNGLFCVHWFKVRCSWLFGWYWWNCWLSQLKLSFHNIFQFLGRFHALEYLHGSGRFYLWRKLEKVYI
jgi:hypothetical protein